MRLCHTQQVRSLAADVRASARPPRPGNQYDYPQLWGTRRIGRIVARIQHSSPRLATYPSLQSRLVVARFHYASVSMAFHGSANQPTQKAGSARLSESLGVLDNSPALTTGADGERPCATPDMAMASEPSARATPPPFSIAIRKIQRQRARSASCVESGRLQEEVAAAGTLFAAKLCFVSWVRGRGMAKLPRVYAEAREPDCCSLLRRTIEQRAVEWSRWVCHAAWRQLPTEDLRALVAYIHKLAPFKCCAINSASCEI